MNRPIRNLIDEFRKWNAAWEASNRDHSLPKPPSVDEFAVECERRFVVSEPRSWAANEETVDAIKTLTGASAIRR